MKHYELLCVLPGTLAEDELSPIMESVKEVITAEGGKGITVEDKGKNRLTYPMKHIRYGYFQVVIFEAEPEIIASIQKKLSVLDGLLRALLNAYNPEIRKKHAKAVENFEKRKTQDFSKPREKDVKKSEEKKVKTVEEVPVSKDTKEKKEEKKVDMKEIDEKLDAILQGDLENV